MSEVKNKAIALARMHAAEAQVEIQADVVSPTQRAGELRSEAETAAQDFPGHEASFMLAYDTELEACMAKASVQAAKAGQRTGASMNFMYLIAIVVVAACLLFYLL